MEMFTVSLGYPAAPLKEHTPRCVRDRFCKMSIFHHVTWLQGFSNNCINLLVMEEPICCLCNEIQTLASNDIVQDSQCFLCFIPPVTSVTLPRQGTLKFCQLTFRLSVKARQRYSPRFAGLIPLRYRLPIRGGEKVLRADIHTTSGFRDTRYCVWHINYDKNVPASSRLFQRDSFRVSDEWTVLADRHFTEFRHFQQVMSSVRFLYRVLTNTFLFPQTPSQRPNDFFVAWMPFFFSAFLTPTEVGLKRFVDTFDSRNLHILGVLAVMRVVLTQMCQMVNLVIKRDGDTAILPHLRTHLEHVVLQFFLMPQFRKKPGLLCRLWICTIFKGAFHASHVSRFYPLISGRAGTSPRGNANHACQRDTSSIPQNAKKVKFIFYDKERTFLPHLKEGVSSPKIR